MNQQAIDYLKQNKDKYTKESLKEQLRVSKYSESDISNAIDVVYAKGNESVAIKQAVPQKANEEVHYAGFWIRFVAMFIDGLVMSIPNLIMYFAVMMLIPDFAGIVVQMVMFITLLLYFVFMTQTYQATLGKMTVGIKVCDANTLNKAESGQVWMREVINRLFLTIPFLVLLEVVAAFTQRKQGLHDMAAKTVVVYKESDKKNSVSFKDASFNSFTSP